MHRRQLLGRAGEDAAAAFLADHGYDIRHRNWRPVAAEVRGELDLVACCGRILAVCEVKTRRSVRAGSPLEAVTADKRRRLRRLTALYLQAHPHRGPVRGDVLAVHATGDPTDPHTHVHHLRGVW